MDIYRILQKLDAVEKKQLTEGTLGALAGGVAGAALTKTPAGAMAGAKLGDKLTGESAKPDFLDLDKDGDKKEPMKKAAKEKNLAEGQMKQWLWRHAEQLDKADFVEFAAEHGMDEDEAVEFWTAINGDDDEDLDEAWPGTPEYELKFGKPEASSAFDKKRVSTGTVYSRKYQDEPETDDDTPKKAGRPTGTGRKLGAKGPGVDSKLLKGKGGLKEHDDDISIVDRGEYDQEGGMVKDNIHTIRRAINDLEKCINDNDNMPEWVEEKISQAKGMVLAASEYIQTQKERSAEDEVAMGEASYSAKAARAGKDIGKPGKNFAKIAKGAAERYGSKERGEKVAGAVLAKLRAKEGVEEAAINETFTKEDYKKLAKLKAWLMKKHPHLEPEEAEEKAAIRLGYDYDEVLDWVHGDQLDEKAPPGAKAERMVKHIKKGYAKDGKLTPKEKSIAYATAWKAHNAGKVEEADKEAKPESEKEKMWRERDLAAHKRKLAQDANRRKMAPKPMEEEDKVEETTVAGSVATAPAEAPKKGKGGMHFGKGVYESEVAESFEKHLDAVLNEGMSLNVSTDDTGKKSINVNATDEDAVALGDLLKMAGMFSTGGYSKACTACGEQECECDHVDESEFANSPSAENGGQGTDYSDTETMTQTLSGGLNGPKTTGQTTVPVLNTDPSRQGVAGKVAEAKQQAESRLWNLYKKYDK